MSRPETVSLSKAQSYGEGHPASPGIFLHDEPQCAKEGSSSSRPVATLVMDGYHISALVVNEDFDRTWSVGRRADKPQVIK